MRLPLSLLLFVLVGRLCGVAAAEPAPAESWFTGTNTQGWLVMNGGSFIASNGVLHVTGGKGWFRTESAFTNFVLELEWRGMETNFNSGIFVRAPLAGNPWATNVWQVNLKQSAVGELLEGSRKAVIAHHDPIAVGAWTTFRIEANGGELKLAIDGKESWRFTELPMSGGYLGLQAEGKSFEFRNLRVTRLP